MSELKLKCAACDKEKNKDDMAVIHRRGTKIAGKMINKERAVCQECCKQGYDVDGYKDSTRAERIKEELNER